MPSWRSWESEWRRRMPAAAEASQLKRGEAGRAGGDVRSDLHVTVEERTERRHRDRAALAGGAVLRRHHSAAGAQCAARAGRRARFRQHGGRRRAAVRHRCAPGSGGASVPVSASGSPPCPSRSAAAALGERSPAPLATLPARQRAEVLHQRRPAWTRCHHPRSRRLGSPCRERCGAPAGAQCAARGGFRRGERMVRINQLPLGLADLEEIVPQSPDLILIPKVENAAAGARGGATRSRGSHSSPASRVRSG